MADDRQAKRQQRKMARQGRKRKLGTAHNDNNVPKGVGMNGDLEKRKLRREQHINQHMEGLDDAEKERFQKHTEERQRRRAEREERNKQF